MRVHDRVIVQNNPVNWVDPWGLEKLILFPANTFEYKAAAAVPDTPGVYVVYAHGSPNFVSPTTSDKNSLDAIALKTLIEKQSNYKSGMPIKLMTCDSAKGKNPIAQQLANALTAPANVSGYDGKVLYRAPLWPFGADVSPLPTVKIHTFRR